MNRKDPAGFAYRLLFDTEELEDFRNSFTAYLKGVGVDASFIDQLELSAYEIAANIIEHSGVSTGSGNISFRGRINKNTVTCRFTYSGPRFDLASAGKVDIVKHFRSGKNRGLGIYIVKTLMDEVRSEYKKGVNTVTFTKRR